MHIVLQCPVCRNPLLNSAEGYRCSRNHSFDAAREGYVNLLLVQNKNSREPGDSKEMVRSRRRFLDLGLYDRISDAVNTAISRTVQRREAGKPFNILDAGCGEGFYLKRLKALLEGMTGPAAVEYYGVDISKFAVRQATQRDKTMNWFVASIVELPFSASSFDVVLNVFSPADLPEFSRVLKDAGALVVATPGPRHLNGLRETIYPNAREHAPATISDEAKGLFSLFLETRITYPVELRSREAIMDLLSMTPYFWNIDRKTRSRVESLTELDLDVDVEVRVLRKAAQR
jgi:23S rRNA (guanine745-N1)-methyltransferase